MAHISTDLNDIAARLDQLWQSIDKGASWESAGHLSNRSIYAIQSIARDVQRLSIETAENYPSIRATHAYG